MNRFAVFLFVSIALLFAITFGPVVTGTADSAYAQSYQSNEFALDAKLIAYYTNIQRRSNGLAPLKTSRELTEAALMFAEDVVVNLDSGYCGHTDSSGRSVGDRLRDNGMVGMQMWGENVVCGYMTPQEAVDAWMASPGHRENILTPEFTEIGIGHFVDGNAGYIVQNFAFYESASPAIINNEAPSTTSPTVELYIYPHTERSGMAGLGSAVEMMISSRPDFAGASWQPFVTETTWTLDAGEGWRRLYIATRDVDGRRAVRFDDIYLGESPSADLSLDSYPSIKTNLSRETIISQLPEAATAASIQLSMDWEICETDSNVQVSYGTVDSVDDLDAHGGTSFRMAASPQYAYTVLWTPEYSPGEAMVGYVRLKVENNQATNEILTVEIRGDKTTYATLSVKASDFHATGVYQEFPIHFTVPTDFKPALVEVHIRQQDAAVIYLDGLSFYTDSQAFTSDFQWNSTRPAYRDRGLRIRTVGADGTVSASHLVFPVTSPVRDESAPLAPLLDVPEAGPPTGEGTTTSPVAQPIQSHITLEAVQGRLTSFTHRAGVTCANCAQTSWIVSSNAQWLSGTRIEDQVEISVNAAGLSLGQHTANLTLVPNSDSSTVASEEIQVVITVTPEAVEIENAGQVVYIPVALK